MSPVCRPQISSDFILSCVGALLLSMGFPADGIAGGSKPRVEREWTVLLYMCADNDLNDAGPEDLNEMEVVGSSDQVTFVGMLDPEGDTGTRIYVPHKDSDATTVTSPVVKEMPEQDMGDWHTLVEFVRWGIEKYPARHYVVWLWNHGSGWNKRSHRKPHRGICFDDSSGNNITTAQMGDAMRQVQSMLGHKLDVLVMDACLMQMAEVGYEVADSVAVQVASEESEPAEGWSHERLLGAIVANPLMDERQMGQVLVRTFMDHYQNAPGEPEAVTMAAIDLRRFAEFRSKLDAFADAAMADPTSVGALNLAASEAQHYDEASYKDLISLLEKAAPRLAAPLSEQAHDLATFVRHQVVFANGWQTETMAGSTGLSIWLPAKAEFTEAAESYGSLAWAREGRWDDLLTWLHSLPNPTRRH